MHYSIINMVESNLVIGKGVLIWSIINIICFINSHSCKFTFTLMHIATFILKWQKFVCFSANINMGFFPCDATDPLLNTSHRFISSQNRYLILLSVPDSKVQGANMGPIWGWQDPGGPHAVPKNFAIWWGFLFYHLFCCICGTFCSSGKQGSFVVFCSDHVSKINDRCYI